jgi:acyl-CoA dehydrogenase
VIATAASARGPALVALPIAAAAVTSGQNLAGEARDTLTFDGTAPVAQVLDSVAASDLRSRMLVYRSLTMLGAGERTLQMTIQHVKDRTQFGRPLAQRQVVQHYVAEMAGATTALRAACDAAILTTTEGNDQRTLAAALATRVEADRMASLVARLAHQLHGAIGFTEEHWLHHATTRLTAWRQDDATEAACALELSRIVPALGGPWEALTG